jgi:hypothetical protein
MEIDRENGNTLWIDAVRQEVKNVRIDLEKFEGDPSTLIGYTQIIGHIIFNYSTVVSRDYLRILLTVSALNDLWVLGADVQNVFLTAPNKEKIRMIAGPEFGPDKGKMYLVV